MLTSTLNKYEIASAGAGPSFNYPYAIHKSTDLTVYVDGDLKATSDGTYPHTVTLAVNKESATVNFTDTSTTAVSGKNIIFERVVDYKQETDLANNSLLDAESLETTLDNIVMQTQQAGLKAAGAIGFDPGIDVAEFHTNVVDATTITLTKANRKLKALAFDANGDITVSVDDIDAQIQAVANSAQAASDSADEASDSEDAALQSKNDAAAELAAFQALYRGASTSTPSNPADGHLWFDTNTGVDLMKVYNATASAWEQLTPTSTNQTNINTVVANTLKTNIGLVAAKEVQIGQLAVLGTAGVDISTVAAIGTAGADVSTVAAITAGDISKVANVDGEVEDVAAIDTEITTLINGTDGTSGTGGTTKNIALVNSVHGKITEVGNLGTSTVVGYMTALNGTNVISHMAALNATGVIADIADVAAVDAEITLLGTPEMAHATTGNLAKLTATGVIGDIETVADSIADVNRYANEYKIATSAPGSPSEGDLWFDSSSNKVFKVYDGTSWKTVTDGQTEAEVTTEATAQAISMAIALG